MAFVLSEVNLINDNENVFMQQIDSAATFLCYCKCSLSKRASRGEANGYQLGSVLRAAGRRGWIISIAVCIITIGE